MAVDVGVVRFGAFELDEGRGELRRDGVVVRLAPQALEVLALLAGRAGEVVTREELGRRVWGAAAAVDLDRNLSVCLAQIRVALGDGGGWVQRVPRQGYRFVAEVRRPDEVLAAGPAGVLARWPWGWMAAGAVLVAAGLWFTRGAGRVEARAMVAVVPFELAAGDEVSSLFGEGLADRLTAQLGGAQPQRLGVMARRSVRARRGSARYVVEGAVRRDEDGWKVSARLVDGRNGARLWTGWVEQGERGPAEFEQVAAQAVADGVVRTLLPGLSSLARRDGGECGSGWASLRRGRVLEMRGGREELLRAVDSFREAVGEEPECVEAGAALADALLHLARMGGGDWAWEGAREAAEWVLSKEPENAEARNVRANVRFWREWQWAAAEQDFVYSLKLNPSLAATQQDYAWLLMALGRTGEALECLRRALELDPLSARIRVDAARLYLQARRYDDAVREARWALRLVPGWGEARECLARALRLVGDERGARLAWPKEGGLGAAVDGYGRAVWLAQRGQRGAALAELRGAVEVRSPRAAMLRAEPEFARYQADPEFRLILGMLRQP